jgi:hypothetical protein
VDSCYEVLSPANNTPGHIILPIAAFEKLQLTSDETTNTPAINVLYSMLS